MANIDLIKNLNAKYGKQSPFLEYKRLEEAYDVVNIKKAFSTSDLGNQYVDYFERGQQAQVVLLFIDVCGFSTRFKDLNGGEIGKYFDDYYDKVIPIIYEYKGEIDKIMGDGIVCVFGPPFLNLDLSGCIKEAETCAKKLIEATQGTKFSSKIALHCGTINYFKNKTGFYNEFTMIGKPLTELFRLESISEDEKINYFDKTEIREYYEPRFVTSSSSSVKWYHDEHTVTNLRGVSYKNYFAIRKIK